MPDRIPNSKLDRWIERASYPDTDETHALVNELAQLRELVEAFTDSDPCWFDHHGGCQSHGYLYLEPGELCPHAEAKQLIESWETTDA